MYRTSYYKKRMRKDILKKLFSSERLESLLVEELLLEAEKQFLANGEEWSVESYKSAIEAVFYDLKQDHLIFTKLYRVGVLLVSLTWEGAIHAAVMESKFDFAQELIGNKQSWRALLIDKRSKENCRPAAELCNSRLIGDRLYTIHRMNDVPNKCESCDAFDDCYVIGKGMKEFCKQEEFNAIYKNAFGEV